MHKKRLAIFFVIILCLELVLPFELNVMEASEKAGTINHGEHLSEVPEDYIGIYSVDDLNHIRLYLDKKYILMNNIDLSEATADGGSYFHNGDGWEPIGTPTEPFTGVLDGNGYQIMGMKINNRIGSVGLLGTIEDATVRNLGVVNGDIQVASISSYSSYYGGLVGRAINSTIEKSYSGIHSQISLTTGSTTYVGGLAGYQQNTAILDSFAFGNQIAKTVPDGNQRVAIAGGGLAGYSDNQSAITRSYSVGKLDYLNSYKYSEKKSPLTEGYPQITDSYNLDYMAEDLSAGKASYEAMQQLATFAGFDFVHTWQFSETSGYPFPILQGSHFSLKENIVTFDGGLGTKFNPYKISTPKQLDHIREYPNSFFELNKSIDLSKSLLKDGGFYHNGNGWEPIGSGKMPFAGWFAGNHFSITGLMINVPVDEKVYAGIFGNAENAVIQDLGVVDGKYMINPGTSDESVYVGGIAGYLSNSVVSNSYSDIDINARADDNIFSGGIGGYLSATTIKTAII